MPVLPQQRFLSLGPPLPGLSKPEGSVLAPFLLTDVSHKNKKGCPHLELPSCFQITETSTGLQLRSHPHLSTYLMVHRGTARRYPMGCLAAWINLVAMPDCKQDLLTRGAAGFMRRSLHKLSRSLNYLKLATLPPLWALGFSIPDIS
ncbi:hypothetical protein DSO57_1026781 [Entomophthora muscae]|uniref:Uncharacterized protein n=1 Tax=Entomophthora muscae TaxID=34485 RepID=A0ACC2SF84_9FUNG|nr:hypothetical protein DSO57_1026781 [Entomophthora muscae]